MMLIMIAARAEFELVIQRRFCPDIVRYCSNFA